MAKIRPLTVVQIWRVEKDTLVISSLFPPIMEIELRLSLSHMFNPSSKKVSHENAFKLDLKSRKQCVCNSSTLRISGWDWRDDIVGLRTLDALLQDLGSIPRTYMAAQNHLELQFQRI